jgi:hypothetical protein
VRASLSNCAAHAEDDVPVKGQFNSPALVAAVGSFIVLLYSVSDRMATVFGPERRTTAVQHSAAIGRSADMPLVSSDRRG